jgi:hypothetical protein
MSSQLLGNESLNSAVCQLASDWARRWYLLRPCLVIVWRFFFDKVKELNDPRCNRSVFLDKERYYNIKREVEEAKILWKNNQPLTSKHYRRLKRYEVINIGDKQKRIESGSGENDDSNIRYYCKM